jgi:hypothetical protein
MTIIINDKLFNANFTIDSKINELSDENKNKYIVKLFNDFYYYLDNIDINKNFDIVNYINDKYLKYKAAKKGKEFDNYIKKIIINNITKNYFDKILEFYHTIKTNNLMINHYCLFFIYKIILLLYSYYCYTYEIMYGYRLTNKIDKIEYRNIINKFRIDFISNNFDVNKHINIFSIKNIDVKDKKFSYFKYNNFLSKILEYIPILHDVYKEPNLKHYKNEFITIPQYMGNCWYISMLTCICYSDLSKKLLLSKIGDETKKNKLISSSKFESNKKFIKTIDYIIKNITNEHKKYGDNIYSNCDKLSFLKENIMDYIYHKYYELNSQNKFKAPINNFRGSNDYYFKALNDKINSNPNKKKINKIKLLTNDIILTNNIRVGADITYAFFIINSLYNIFNISTLYLYDYIHSNNYLRQQEIEYDSEKSIKSPDIIFIHKKEFQPNGSFISFDKNKITKLDKSTILYNNYKYKLDFILHSTDSNNTCSTCAHCISGIHYNGEQYYHDSGYTDLMVKCDSSFIGIPCTLIHQKWINDIDKADTYLKSKNYEHVKDICLFNIQKCFYKTTDITSQNLNKNIIFEDNICFNNLFNLIYGYVKINDEEIKEKEKEKKEEKKEKKKEDKENKEEKKKEDKEEKKKEEKENKEIKEKKEIKFKSSGVKVDVMNNKKVIKRIIYLDKNKNKYIKFNKDYILLSNLLIKDDIYYLNEPKKQKKEEKKLKSSGVKVDVINNKKIIKRIIYIDENKNKYVKLNKEYELLSNLKYSGTFYYK